MTVGADIVRNTAKNLAKDTAKDTARRTIALGAIVLTAACVSKPKTDSVVYRGHGAAAVDPQVVKSFAPPPLPVEVARSVQNILEISTPGLGVLSPDGKAMYFTWAVSGVPQVWKIDGPMRFPVQMTSGTDPTLIFGITPDGNYLVLSRDHAGEEDPGIYLLPTSGGPLIEIQHKKGARAGLAWITNDSRTIYFMANDIKPDSYALYSYDIETKNRELLFSEPGLWSVVDVRGDSRFLLSKATGARTREYYEWSVSERKLEPVLGQSEKEEYVVQFAPKAGEYFVVASKFGDFRRLYLYSHGKFDPITPDVQNEIDGISVDHAFQHLYIQWNEQGFAKLEIRDAKTLAKVTTPPIEGAEGIFAGLPSRFGRYISISGESSRLPRSSFVYDWKERKLTQWSRPSLPEIETARFSATQLEFYPARDGTKIPMLVSRPKTCAADPCPVVVHFHGGPESQARPTFNGLSQIFTSAGFIFVSPNVRGSDGYGRAYRDSDNGEKRLNVVTDIEDCSRHIKSNWGKNGIAPRVGVMGWSYGGYSTLFAMSRFAGAYDAGVALVGMSDLRTFLSNTAAYRRSLRTSEYGDPEKDAEALRKLSPITYIDQVRDPLMIIQGVSDPRVPVGEALQFHRALESRGVSSPLILFSEEGHGSIKRDDRVLEIGHALLFMQKNLLGRDIATRHGS